MEKKMKNFNYIKALMIFIVAIFIYDALNYIPILMDSGFVISQKEDTILLEPRTEIANNTLEGIFKGDTFIVYAEDGIAGTEAYTQHYKNLDDSEFGIVTYGGTDKDFEVHLIIQDKNGEGTERVFNCQKDKRRLVMTPVDENLTVFDYDESVALLKKLVKTA